MHALSSVEPRNVNAAEIVQDTPHQREARNAAENIQNARMLAERAVQAALGASGRVTRESPAADIQTAFREAKLQAKLAEASMLYAKAEKHKITGFAAAHLLREAEAHIRIAERAATVANAGVVVISSYIPSTTPSQPVPSTLDEFARTPISPARVVIIRSAQIALMATYAQNDLIEAMRDPSVLNAGRAQARISRYHQEALEFRALIEENLARVDHAASTKLAQDLSLARTAITLIFQTTECATEYHLRQLQAANPPRPRPLTPSPPAKTAT